MENLFQRLEKNWELYLFDKKFKKKPLKNRNDSSFKVIVCVSGGCDSVALIHLLYKLRKLLFLDLHILHFNHQIRSEADQEQIFVKTLAENLKLPFYFKKNKNFFLGQPGFQEAARKWRISESQNLLKNIKGDYIATAHHADDQIETVLIKMLRGVHLSKIQGMSWQNPPFIRPLLNFKKIELEDYLKRNNQNWMNDPSNKNPKYLRNRVRLELMPLLEELTRDSLQSRLFALMDQSSTIRDWLDYNFQNWSKIVDKKYTRKDILYVSDLLKVEKILQQEILYNFISGITGKSLNFRKLMKIFELIYSNSDYWEQHIFAQWKISRHGGEIRLINSSRT